MPSHIRQLAGAAVVGAAAGLTATYAMTRAQDALTKRFPPPSPPPGQSAADPPPVRMASKLVHVLFHRAIEDERKVRDAALVSYGFGAAIGAGYSVLTAYVPIARIGRGAVFGAALWVVGDVVTAPLLDVADSLATTPPRIAAIDAAGHVVFGLVAETVRFVISRT